MKKTLNYYSIDEINLIANELNKINSKNINKIKHKWNCRKAILKVIGKKYIDIYYIIKVICDYFNILDFHLNCENRKREFVQARQIAHYFSKNLTKLTLAKIGSEIGNKHHATVLYSCKTVNNLCETNTEYRKMIKEIENLIKNEPNI